MPDRSKDADARAFGIGFQTDQRSYDTMVSSSYCATCSSS